MIVTVQITNTKKCIPCLTWPREPNKCLKPIRSNGFLFLTWWYQTSTKEVQTTALPELFCYLWVCKGPYCIRYASVMFYFYQLCKTSVLTNRKLPPRPVLGLTSGQPHIGRCGQWLLLLVRTLWSVGYDWSGHWSRGLKSCKFLSY